MSGKSAAAFTLSPEEQEERRLMSNIISILSNHKVPTNVIPTLCLVGVQSHGKSSLCEYFVGFPLTLIADDTGTRCPTKFFLKFDPNASTPQCSVVGVPKEIEHLHHGISVQHPHHIAYKDLPAELGKYMAEIGDTTPSGFSADTLEVHINSDTCPNLFFVDLPGIVGEIDPRHDTINNIVRQYLDVKSVIPVMVVKASEDMATGLLYSFMKKYGRPGWKKESVFVATHFDSKLPKNGRGLENLLECHCADPEDPSLRRQITKYFVSLNPPPHIDRATMLQKKHSELTARIRSLEKLEDRMLQSTFSIIRESIHPEFDYKYWGPFLGLKMAKSAIKKTWFQCYRKQFNTVRQALVNKLADTKEEVRKLEELAISSNPDNLRATCASIITQFVQTVKAIYVQDHTMWIGSASFEKAGVSYIDESLDYHSNGLRTHKWEKETSPESLNDPSGPCSAGFRRELNAALLGSAQLRRLFRVNRAIIGLCNLPSDSYETWCNAVQCIGSEANWLHAISQVSGFWLKQQLVPSVEYLAGRVHRIFHRVCELAIEQMQSDVTPSYAPFLGKLRDHFIDFITNRIKSVVTASLHLINSKSSWSDIGLAPTICMLSNDLAERIEYLEETDKLEEGDGITEGSGLQKSTIESRRESDPFKARRRNRFNVSQRQNLPIPPGARPEAPLPPPPRRTQYEYEGEGSRHASPRQNKVGFNDEGSNGAPTVVNCDGTSIHHSKRHNGTITEAIPELTTDFEDYDGDDEQRMRRRKKTVAPQTLDQIARDGASRRLKAMLGEDAVSFQLPSGTFLSDKALAKLSGIAELHYLSQMTFMVHDIEALFVADVQNCIEDPSKADPISNTCFSGWMNQMLYSSKTNLDELLSIDHDEIQKQVADLKEYQRTLTVDLDGIEGNLKELKALFDNTESSLSDIKNHA